MRLFNNPGNGTEVVDSEDIIDQLTRRRAQLSAELERKRKLLSQYEEQEREFLGTDSSFDEGNAEQNDGDYGDDVNDAGGDGAADATDNAATAVEGDAQEAA